MIFTSKDNLVK